MRIGSHFLIVARRPRRRKCEGKEYVALPERLVQDREQLSSWTGKALAYGESLEPKNAKAKSKSAAKKSSKGKPAKKK
jgi:hypothetical protein